jgi:hypothetical protein
MRRETDVLEHQTEGLMDDFFGGKNRLLCSLEAEQADLDRLTGWVKSLARDIGDAQQATAFLDQMLNFDPGLGFRGMMRIACTPRLHFVDLAPPYAADFAAVVKRLRCSAYVPDDMTDQFDRYMAAKKPGRLHLSVLQCEKVFIVRLWPSLAAANSL